MNLAPELAHEFWKRAIFTEGVRVIAKITENLQQSLLGCGAIENVGAGSA